MPSRTRGHVSGGMRRRYIAKVRERKVIELYVEGYGSFQRIADHPEVQVSAPRVSQILKNAFHTLNQETNEMAEFARTIKLEELARAKREAYLTMTRKCPICMSDEGRTEPDSPDEAPGFCDACGATGRFYGVDERMRALDRYLKVVVTESDMEGISAPRKIDITVTSPFLSYIASLPEDQLENALEAYALSDGTYSTEPEHPERLEIEAAHDDDEGDYELES